MPPARQSPEQQQRERARIEQIEKEARQASQERARQLRLAQDRRAQELRDQIAADPPRGVLMGLSPAGPRAIRVSADGCVQVRLHDDDRAELHAVLRIAREAKRGGTGAGYALERIMAITERVLERYNEPREE